MTSIMSTPSSIKKAYIDLPEGQIHYRYTATPATKAPIIFLHKSASSSASFSHLQCRYAALSHTTYAPDLPGFGSSFDPSTVTDDESRTTAWYCTILSRFLSALNLKTYHLVGHHAGGCLALELAVSHPSSVLSLTLIGPTLISAPERQTMASRFYAPFNAPVASGAHLLATWEYLQAMGLPATDLDLLQQEFLDHAVAWKGRSQIYGAVWQQDGQDLFRRVRCRVLCLCAKDDVLWEYFHWVKELRGDAGVEVGVVRGANFACELDFEGVAARIDRILGSC